MKPIAPRRASYARIYLVVLPCPPFSLCDKKDGFLLAWTDWDLARAHASTGYVTNWEQFSRRNFIARMAKRPPAMRLIDTRAAGRERRFHVELDANPEEMRELNEFVVSDYNDHPRAIREKKAKAKVWEEV